MLVEKLGALGIPTFFPSTESMAQIDDMIEALGARLGSADTGRRLVEKVRARRNEVSRALESEPIVRVLFLFGLSPIVAAGPASFANEMVALARGRNVVTSGGAYPTLSAERLLVLAPELVINGAAMTGSAPPAGGGVLRGDPSLADHPALRELEAVRAGRTVAIYDEAVLRPGPRVGEGLATLARAIHPGASVP
jgi:iron complex transport system substrate-binding protein